MTHAFLKHNQSQTALAKRDRINHEQHVHVCFRGYLTSCASPETHENICARSWLGQPGGTECWRTECFGPQETILLSKPLLTAPTQQLTRTMSIYSWKCNRYPFHMEHTMVQSLHRKTVVCVCSPKISPVERGQQTPINGLWISWRNNTKTRHWDGANWTKLNGSWTLIQFL